MKRGDAIAPQGLERLAIAHGIEVDYRDVWGKRRSLSPTTLASLLNAMGVPVDSEKAIRNALRERTTREWRRVLPPVIVAGEGTLTVPFTIPQASCDRLWQCSLSTEEGDVRKSDFLPSQRMASAQSRIGNVLHERYVLPIPAQLPIGYHRLEMTPPDGASPWVTSCVITPRRCYVPPALAASERLWGTMVQLYGVRSARNWGMGDYADLSALVDFAAHAGAGLVGVNPLHALSLTAPADASPYSPSTRCGLNVLYLDVEGMEDFAESTVAREMALEAEFQNRLRSLRAAELVNYEGVARAKLHVLDVLHQHFRAHHIGLGSARAKAFRDYCAEQGESLREHALFEALMEHVHRRDAATSSWRQWPAAYQDRHSAAVSAFAREHAERIEYFQYLQWQSDLQLEAAGRRCVTNGLPVGIFQDLAIGSSDNGVETWAHPELFASGAHIGAPPDVFSPDGQDWGLPPLLPDQLTTNAYSHFVRTLRQNMKHAGALRMDHVMGLSRLFWVPADAKPEAGGYVRYPVDDLLGILALESHRNRCMVIGEDLGTVSEALRLALAGNGVLSYRLLYFEKRDDGEFKAPADYPAQAAAAISTHDLPTLRGFWEGADIAQRKALGMYASDESEREELFGRAKERTKLLGALTREQLRPIAIGPGAYESKAMTPDLNEAIHRLLARAPSQVMLVQCEDLFAQPLQANFPGSGDKCPNWQRRLPVSLEDWRDDPVVMRLAQAISNERDKPLALGSAAQGTPVPSVSSSGSRTHIPLATYRFQFNHQFGFRDATALVPYLAALGVSHCYASPYLKARTQSGHGYDVIDHNALNPEIGTQEEFDEFCATLASHGMSQVVDLVPNHMGVLRGDNAWWLDVLENGQASAYASYFDIDWMPLKEQLRGRVLLPVLGEHYGSVLEQGHLQIAFDEARGQFGIHYFEHRFPIDPAAYPRILGDGVRMLDAFGGDAKDAQTLKSLMSDFAKLPSYDIGDDTLIARRRRDMVVLKQGLAELCARNPNAMLIVRDAVARINGRVGEPASFDVLHALIEVQPYRLAFWRVAADEINYRRFFDINELAAVRMEDEAVFAATHRLVLEWVSQNRVEGLRIDHPDGLYDPGEYFRRLQHHVAAARTGAPETSTPAGQVEGEAIYLVVEKILADHERMPADWPVHGTTGYRFGNVVNGLFVDTGSETKMTRIYRNFTGVQESFDELAYRSKTTILRAALSSELGVLANALSRIAQMDRHTCDFTQTGLRDALLQVIACFPVYRTYLTRQGISDADRRYIEWAVAVARKNSPSTDVSIYDFVRDVLTGNIAQGKGAAYGELVLRFGMKFQQLSGPVMAKGVEDTSFYLYNRLVSLNEVGGDPRCFGFTLKAFHGASLDRAKNWPHTMLTSSTHDSKRSEDVRARINVLSESPALWRLAIGRWSRLNRAKKRRVDGVAIPSRNDEYLLYQTLLGIWPLEEVDEAGLCSLRERVAAYMVKAAREAKTNTSWINPNDIYETGLVGFVDAILDNLENRFLSDFLVLQKHVARFGMLNSLSQTLIKCTSPGVPDLFQGNEIFCFHLVDPDNRGAVDFATRQAMLKALMALPTKGVEQLVRTMSDGRIKLYTIWKALQLRQALPSVFQSGEYVPIPGGGERADHVCAFARRQQGRMVIVVVPRLLVRLLGEQALSFADAAIWGDTWIEVPESHSDATFSDVLNGSRHRAQKDSKRLSVATLLEEFPLGLLVDQPEEGG